MPELAKDQLVHAIMTVLIVLVIVIAAGIIMWKGGVFGFIKNLDVFGGSKQKEEMNTLKDAFIECKNQGGNNCICETNINLKFTGKSITVENYDENGEVGVLLTPGDIPIPDVQGCLVLAPHETPSNPPVGFWFYRIYENEGGTFELKSDNNKIEYSLSELPEKARNEINNTPFYSSDMYYSLSLKPIKLFRYEKNNVVYLCLIPDFQCNGRFTRFADCPEAQKKPVVLNVKSCKEVNSCKYLCNDINDCPSDMLNTDYQGKGICCKVSCGNSQNEQLAKTLYLQALDLYSNGKYSEAKTEFEKIYNGYIGTTFADDALLYLGLISSKMDSNQNGQTGQLIKWKELLNKFSDVWNSEYGNAFMEAEEKSDDLLNCDAKTQEECLKQRDSLLNGCYWKLDAWYSFIGPDGICKSCEGISCSDFTGNWESCRQNYCRDVGDVKCIIGDAVFVEAASKAGLKTKVCREDSESSILACRDVTNEFICNIQTCVLIDKTGDYKTAEVPKNCCKWDTNKCVEA